MSFLQLPKSITNKLGLFALALVGLLLSACGTLALEVEAGVTSITETSSLTDARPVTIPRMAPTATPVTPQIDVAFFNNGDVWLWSSEDGAARPLTQFGDVNSSVINLSDDGRFVLFTRGRDIWLTQTDGAGDQRLLTPDDLAELDPFGSGVEVNQIDWVPGLSTLAFNTRQRNETGIIPYEDLHLIDVTTLKRQQLLQAGHGGAFTYSDDGSQIALVKPGIISLVDAEGANRRDAILTYTPARTYEADRYYAEPVWSSDGKELLVPILPADPFAQPAQQTTIWRVPSDGSPPELTANVSADPFGRFVLAPDQGLVAYQSQSIGDSQDVNHGQLLITNLAGGKTTLYAEELFTIISDWSPGAPRIAFLSEMENKPERLPQARIGQPDHESQALSGPDGTILFDLRWINADSYLTLGRPINTDAWLLLLGQPGLPVQQLAIIDEEPGGDVPSYDYTITRP